MRHHEDTGLDSLLSVSLTTVRKMENNFVWNLARKKNRAKDSGNIASSGQLQRLPGKMRGSSVKV